MLRRIEITTDYPVLGDSDHSVKTGWAWAWDRDKYVQISIDDQLYWVKRGYIQRKLDGKPLGDYQLAYLPEKVWSNSGKTHTPGTLPTRLQAAREVMADRRRRGTRRGLQAARNDGLPPAKDAVLQTRILIRTGSLR